MPPTRDEVVDALVHASKGDPFWRRADRLVREYAEANGTTRAAVCSDLTHEVQQRMETA